MVNEDLLRKLMNRKGVVPSPGDSTFIRSLTESKAIELAVLHHHRFAFYYWLKWSTDRWTKSLDASRRMPDLVTIDYHDDVGAPSDCIADELALLIGELEVKDASNDAERKDATRRSQEAERNVATYSVLGLHILNDGHILPAQYLNAINNVYVLNKQKKPHEMSFTDRYGKLHHIRYFKSVKKLIDALNDEAANETYFDLDVDYFFKEHRSGTHGRERMILEEEIRALMNPKAELMSTILHRKLQGVTFALEPTYCGGLPGCFKAMSIVTECLFKGDLLGGKELKWRMQ